MDSARPSSGLFLACMIYEGRIKAPYPKRKYRDAFEMLACMRTRRRARLHASVVIQSVLDASGQTFEDADGYHRTVLQNAGWR
uniref:hypothetical protein n=1 Tax=Burkholderia diffusa TaxID=488732 RepID=UPI001CC5B205|nr:hypothetical protein [Burkholderia diffusa]